MTFAAVLGLDGADKGSIGAMAGPLQHAFHIGKTDLGLLLTTSLLVTAGATCPFGWLVDRSARVRLLSWTVAGWAGVMALSAFASSYEFLLWSRVALGVVSASAGPAIASLIGDEFKSGERASVYSSVLTGEIVGTGVGFVLAGELASWTWRAGFAALAVPAAALAWMLRRIPEPARSGSSPSRPVEAGESGYQSQMATLLRQHDVQPRSRLVLHEDPVHRSLWWALKYVLEIPTNRVLIVSSALGYFYFTGLRTFGVEYVRRWFAFGHGESIVLTIAVGAGSIAGVVLSGRYADRRTARGDITARPTIAALAFLVSAGFFVLAILQRSIWIGLPLLSVAAAALGAVNPPLDAARLEIMHPALWGRAEAVRTLLRTSAEAGAPISFGFIAEHFFRHASAGAGDLHATFLVMSGALAAGGLVGLLARRTYARDVATALAGIGESF